MLLPTAQTKRRRAILAITTTSLLDLASSIGVSLTEHKTGKKGYYLHYSRTISLRNNLSERAFRSTLAHELAHAIHGDEPTGLAWMDSRIERRADEFAAQLLIDPAEYAAAEAQHGPHDDAIAYELGVTRHLLAAWRSLHERQFQP